MATQSPMTTQSPNGDPEPDDDPEPDGEDFDPDDWAEVPSERASAVAASTHGDGDSEGRAPSAKAEAEVTLSAEQADVVITHSSRMSAPSQATYILRNIGGAMGASLTSLLTRLQHIETTPFRPRLEADAAVATALKASLVAEQAPCHRQRVEFQEQAQKKKDLKRISEQFEQMMENIRKAQK